MGITIESKRHSCDMGYIGFMRFRNLVAEKVSVEFGKHYKSSEESLFLFGEQQKKNFFEQYDAKTIKFVKEKTVTIEIVNFLHKSDYEGKIDRKQSKQIYELIKDCNEKTVFGYAGRSDCATMKDMKIIFSDNTKVEWR